MSSSVAKATVIVLAFLMTSVTLLAVIIEPAQAQYAKPISGPIPTGVTPNGTATTKAYLSFRPNPVGVGQPFLVNVWVAPAPGAGRWHPNYKITITKPDGKQDIITMDSYVADGTAWLEYMADQIGQWKIKFDFTGTYFPAGNYSLTSGAYNAANPYTTYASSVYYKPDSTEEQTLTVQQDMVMSWPLAPLPTDYWTRPVHPQNREWWTILGDFPWRGPGGGPVWDQLYPDTNPYWTAYPETEFIPWTQAPNSAHIAWKRQYSLAGLMGGNEGTWSLLGESEQDYFPQIILQGRAYQYLTKVNPTGPGSQMWWMCYDIRTGDSYWERPLYAGETAPNIIEYGSEALAVPGEDPKPATPNLLSISNGYLRKYDPLTGALICNVSIAPMTGSGGTYYMNGYVLGVQNLGTGKGYRLINWTTYDTSANFTTRIMSNTSYASSALPTRIDWQVGFGATVSSVSEGGAYVAMIVRGFNLYTGQQLWENRIDEPQYSGANHLADHGKIAVFTAKGRWYAYDLATGKQAWISETLDYPWDECGFGDYNIISAYGKFYRTAYSGVYAVDWDTGKIVWKYEQPADFAYDDPYTNTNGTTVYSFRSGQLIADGKLYVYNLEHSPEQPIKRGWKLHCINITTGEGIWNITGFCGRSRRLAGGISDGYFSFLNSYDGYQYIFGKGKSATTVAAPDVVVSKGTGVVIKGTVLDMSPAQPNTPCVSKDSMSTQMQYLHVQMPISGIKNDVTITGVPVTLTAIDSEGSYIDLGTVTTDGYYGTFSKTWVPDKEGEYKIIASFAGDDSYGSSGASTAVTVGPAPVTTDNNQQQITVPDYTMLILGGIIATIITVAIVGALLFITLRKR